MKEGILRNILEILILDVAFEILKDSKKKDLTVNRQMCIWGYILRLTRISTKMYERASFYTATPYKAREHMGTKNFGWGRPGGNQNCA